MTTQKLKQRFTGRQQTGYGHFKIGFIIRGKEKTCVTTNTRAMDRINGDWPEKRTPKAFYTTEKQAYQSLYDEVVRANC